MFRQLLVSVPPVAVVVVPLWIALRVLMHRGGAVSARREAILLGAVLYGVVLVALTLYPTPSARHSLDATHVNLTPFESMRCVLVPFRRVDTRLHCLQNVAGNVVLFLPFGLLAPVIHRRLSWWAVLPLALALSVAIEAAQYIERSFGLSRGVDVDDVICNVAGAGLGYLVWWAFRPARTAAA